MRVLIVEDSPDLCELFEDFLRELGHHARIARSAEAALAMLRTERPDLILLDVQLPGMSGLDFLQLRAVRDARIPVVAVSGVATESQARQCLKLGALDFLAKPVFLDRLSEVLACFEPYAIERRAEMAGRLVERRRAPRARIALPVTVREYSGDEWRTRSVDLSVSGIKIAPASGPRPGPAVKLSLAPPDDDPCDGLLSLLVRVDLDGYAFYFVNLSGLQAGRLARLVDRLRTFPLSA